jgi:hypothetical protein
MTYLHVNMRDNRSFPDKIDTKKAYPAKDRPGMTEYTIHNTFGGMTSGISRGGSSGTTLGLRFQPSVDGL